MICKFFSLGGLAAVIYTDTLQTVIMLIGAFVLMIVGKYCNINIFFEF